MFKTDFRRIYSEFLKEYGYSYCLKLNYFTKVINDELLFFLGYRCTKPVKRIDGRREYVKGNKAFTIRAGCTSIYMPSMDKDYIEWKENDISRYIENSGLKAIQYKGCFLFDSTYETEAIHDSLHVVQEFVLPALEQIQDLKSFIQYSKNYGIDGLTGADIFSGNSLTLILADNHDDFMDVFNEHLNEAKKMFDAGRYKNSSYTLEEEYNLLYDGIIEGIAKSRDKVYADPKLYQEALEEAARRKAANLKQLRAYGIAV